MTKLNVPFYVSTNNKHLECLWEHVDYWVDVLSDELRERVLGGSMGRQEESWWGRGK